MSSRYEDPAAEMRPGDVYKVQLIQPPDGAPAPYVGQPRPAYVGWDPTAYVHQAPPTVDIGSWVNVTWDQEGFYVFHSILPETPPAVDYDDRPFLDPDGKFA